MPTFSFTAPVVTEEDERTAREALTDEERKRLHDEEFGQEEDVEESADMLNSGVAMVLEAIDMIPSSRKEFYLVAHEKVPELVETESSALAFLRGCGYDVWEAAERLVSYWDIRNKMFGPTRALLPMTLDGAMNEDVKYLLKGLVFVLPDDENGRPVLYFDRILASSDTAPRDSVVRCIFYAFQTLAEQEKVQKKGYVTIINYRSYELYKHFDRALSKKVVLSGKCMPIRGRSVHACTGPGVSVLDIVLPILKSIFGKEYLLRTHYHAGSASELLHKMAPYGFSALHVNCIYGRNSTNQEHLHAWLEQRRVLEQMRSDEQH